MGGQFFLEFFKSKFLFLGEIEKNNFFEIFLGGWNIFLKFVNTVIFFSPLNS